MANRQNPQDEWIYNQVFAAILEQRLTPGAKLTEAALCDIFDVSRTTIRRVLLRLSLDKVVDLRPNRGAVIAEPYANDVREIFAARRLLENGVVMNAARHCTKAKAAALADIVNRENACIRSGDRSGAIRQSGEFHLEIARIAGNTPLHELLRQLVAQTSLAIALYEAPGHLLCVEDDHKDIVTAIGKGDVEHSRTLMEAHLNKCENELRLELPKEKNNLRAVFADIVRDRVSA